MIIASPFLCNLIGSAMIPTAREGSTLPVCTRTHESPGGRIRNRNSGAANRRLTAAGYSPVHSCNRTNMTAFVDRPRLSLPVV